jgi:stage II sporulation protein R
MKMFGREFNLISISVGVGVLVALSVAAYTHIYSAVTQLNIAENVMRFHVMAHANSFEEQELKDYVSAEILDEFADVLANFNNIEEAREMLAQMLPELQEYAQRLVRNAGFEHAVSAEITNTFFPTQVYGSIAFPPGNYDALQITIGDGDGQNWWCLMFPPLCYVDMTATDNGRDTLAATVSDESFRLLAHQNQPDVVVRFRIVEWWQNIGNNSPQQPAQIVQR